MAKFTTRVELHNVKSITEYDELHHEMEKRGFSRLIKRKGVTYHLPHAEYNYSGDQTKNRVLALAKDAVAALDASASILVTESKGSRVWDGLKIKNKVTSNSLVSACNFAAPQNHCFERTRSKK